MLNTLYLTKYVHKRAIIFFNLTNFYILGQKFFKFFRWYFGKFKTSNFHSEIT